MANQSRYKKEIELLLEDGNHWTAEQIYAELKKHYRFLGIGTVYRNLTQLVNEEKIMKTSGILEKTMYEKKKPLHGHIVCQKSGRITDVDIHDVLFEGITIPENFNLQNINIVFDGHYTGDDAVKCDGIAQVMKQTQ